MCSTPAVWSIHRSWVRLPSMRIFHIIVHRQSASWDQWRAGPTGHDSVRCLASAVWSSFGNGEWGSTCRHFRLSLRTIRCASAADKLGRQDRRVNQTASAWTVPVYIFRQSCPRRALRHATPTVWNCLPPELTNKLSSTQGIFFSVAGCSIWQNVLSQKFLLEFSHMMFYLKIDNLSLRI